MSINDLDLAIEAAQAGAAVVRSYYGTALTRFEKSPGDFATTADIEAENAILDVLRAARPDDVMIGEESGRAGTDGNGRVWLIDPLCGTLNYAARTMLVSVNIALRTGTHGAVAASVDPFADEVFWTDDVRAGLRRNGIDEPLVPSAESRLVDVNLDPPYTDKRVVRLLADDGFIEQFRPRVVSTTLAVAWVAAGRRAAFVTEGHVHDSVHYAAGIAVCQAAGCTVTGIDGQPLDDGAGGLVVAADEETHAALLALIRNQ